MRLIQKSFALLDKLGSRSDPRVQMSLLLIWTHSLRAKYFSRRTHPTEVPLGGAAAKNGSDLIRGLRAVNSARRITVRGGQRDRQIDVGIAESLPEREGLP